MNEKLIVIGETDALVVVDMQNDFCLPTGRLYVAGVLGEPEMDEVIQNVHNLLMEFPFGYEAYTLDEHPPESVGHVEYGIYGPHVVIGTQGVDMVGHLADISFRRASLVIIKGHDKNLISYSASVSLDWGKLIGDLRKKGIKRVFVCGVAFTHCAGETALDIQKQGFETYVVRDATRSVPPPYGDPELMEKKLALYGVKLVTMADFS